VSRPIYESPGDRDAERAVIESVCSRWKATYIKLPKAYNVDYLISTRKGPRAWIEVKCRGRWYDEMLISLNKVYAGQRHAEMTGLPFIMMYCVGDDIRWIDLTNASLRGESGLKLSVGGRTDRGDSQDVEPVVMIPVEMLMQLR